MRRGKKKREEKKKKREEEKKIRKEKKEATPRRCKLSTYLDIRHGAGNPIFCGFREFTIYPSVYVHHSVIRFSICGVDSSFLKLICFSFDTHYKCIRLVPTRCTTVVCEQA